MIFSDEFSLNLLKFKTQKVSTPNSDLSLSPEITEMMHTEGDFIEAKNYTVQLAHFFSHLGNFRRPVDPALCLAFDFFEVTLQMSKLPL